MGVTCWMHLTQTVTLSRICHSQSKLQNICPSPPHPRTICLPLLLQDNAAGRETSTSPSSSGAHCGEPQLQTSDMCTSAPKNQPSVPPLTPTLKLQAEDKANRNQQPMINGAWRCLIERKVTRKIKTQGGNLAVDT